MIETIITICSLYMGQQAIDCRVHIRHCVENKNAQREKADAAEAKITAAEAVAAEKMKTKICKTKVADRAYCAEDGLLSRSFYIDQYSVSYVKHDYTQEYVNECAEKEGVL